MIRRPPRSTLSSSSAASDVYKRQVVGSGCESRLTCGRWAFEHIYSHDPPEPRDKLDAMTAHAFEVAMAGLGVNGPEDVKPDWDAIRWRAHEDNVRRLRQRIFKATLCHECGRESA